MGEALTRLKGVARSRPPWPLLLAGLAAAAMLAWLASRVTIPLPPYARARGGLAGSGPHRRPPQLVLAGGAAAAAKGVVGERLWLLDPAPLFLPLRARAGVLSRSREPLLAEPTGTAGELFPPRLRFSEGADLRALLRPSVTAKPAAAAGMLWDPKWFIGLSRADAAGGQSGASGLPPVTPGAGEPSAAERALQLRVFGINQDAPQAVLAWGARGGISVELWKPLILILLVDKSGRWSTPAITVGSGIDEVDEKIRWIVARELLPTLRLRPGIYRLEVGP